MNLANVATEVSAVVGVGAALGAIGAKVAKRWINDAVTAVRSDTQQLRRNGGSHVADHAEKAYQESVKTNEELAKLKDTLTDHLIASARQTGAYDTKFELLMSQQFPLKP